MKDEKEEMKRLVNFLNNSEQYIGRKISVMNPAKKV